MQLFSQRLPFQGRKGKVRESNLRRRRPGVCHRCGWRGVVGKVRRGDRKYLASGGDFGRLCDECVTDLFRGQTASRENPEVGQVKLTVVRDRDVA